MPATEVLVEGLDHPEGVAWDPEANVLWAGGEDGQLYRVDIEARTWELAARAPGFVLGLAVDGRGRVVVCCQGAGALCALDGGVVHTVRNGLVFPNYPAFAPDGALFFSDSGRWGSDDGHVYRLDADGALDVLTDRLPHFPNGCAVTADGSHLWLVESRVPTVNRIDVASGDVEEIARLDGTVPDGIAFTADGDVIVSCYRPDRIVRLARDGTTEVIAEDPQGTLLAAPTNVVFVGERLDRLVAANLGRWHLTLLDVGVRGAPLHYPTGWAADA